MFQLKIIIFYISIFLICASSQVFADDIEKKNPKKVDLQEIKDTVSDTKDKIQEVVHR